MPSTVSPEAQSWLASLTKKKSQPQTLAERRIATDAWRKQDSAEARKLYPVNVEETNIAGVRADIITPLAMPEANRGRVLINLHGGGFVSDSGSLIEGIPIANLAKIKVVSVYYRLAPENPFPGGGGRCGSGLQGTTENLQPARHRNLRHVGGSHPDLRGHRSAQATGTTAPGSAWAFSRC